MYKKLIFNSISLISKFAEIITDSSYEDQFHLSNYGIE